MLDGAGVETTTALPLNVQVPMIGPHEEPIPPDGLLPYSLGDIANPLGTNDLPAHRLFEERQMYKDVPYFMGLPDLMDSWYDKLYFGRVDRIQNGIILKKDPNHLKEIPSEKGNIFALNFVADAFEALKRYMRAWGDAGKITTISLYYDLTAVSALENPYRNLDALRRIWSKALAARIVDNPERDKKTLDFKSYVRELLSYMKAGSNRRPLTVTGYMVSNFSTPMNTGLSIQLALENYGTDATKLNKYILDPNFRFFVKAARKFGFYVDRNAPWRIIADPFSTPMLQRMAPYLQPASFGNASSPVSGDIGGAHAAAALFMATNPSWATGDTAGPSAAHAAYAASVLGTGATPVGAAPVSVTAVSGAPAMATEGSFGGPPCSLGSCAAGPDPLCGDTATAAGGGFNINQIPLGGVHVPLGSTTAAQLALAAAANVGTAVGAAAAGASSFAAPVQFASPGASPPGASTPSTPADLAAVAAKFFHHYYRRTYSLEWGYEGQHPNYPYGLQLTLKKMYTDFITEYPRVKTTTSATVRCPQTTIGDRVETISSRKPVTNYDLVNYGDMYWLDLYFKIRLHEAGIKFSNYDQHLRTVREIYKFPNAHATAFGSRPHAALRYINNEIKPYLYNLRVGAKSLTRGLGPVRIGSVKDY